MEDNECQSVYDLIDFKVDNLDEEWNLNEVM